MRPFILPNTLSYGCKDLYTNVCSVVSYTIGGKDLSQLGFWTPMGCSPKAYICASWDMARVCETESSRILALCPFVVSVSAVLRVLG